MFATRRSLLWYVLSPGPTGGTHERVAKVEGAADAEPTAAAITTNGVTQAVNLTVTGI